MSKAFEVGSLRHRLTWMSQQAGPRMPGRQDTTIWVPSGPYWAAVMPLGGAELYQALQLKATTKLKIVMRSRPIRVADRLVLQGVTPHRTFVVDTISRVDEVNEFIAINASELLP